MSKIEVKKNILNAALELFAKNGYEAVSVEQIADAVGMKGPNVYKYFKGKADIIKELHTFVEEIYIPKMQMEYQYITMIHNSEELKIFSMRQIRITMTDEYVKMMRRIYTLEQYRNEVLRDRATIHQIDNLKNQYMKIFDKLIEFGEIEPCDTEMLAYEYFAPISLFIQQSDREPEKTEELLALVEKYIDFFIEKNFIKKSHTTHN